MIAPGDITPRRDSDHELYVVVASNTIHLAAATGRVITCPFILGEIPSDNADRTPVEITSKAGRAPAMQPGHLGGALTIAS